MRYGPGHDGLREGDADCCCPPHATAPLRHSSDTTCQQRTASPCCGAAPQPAATQPVGCCRCCCCSSSAPRKACHMQDICYHVRPSRRHSWCSSSKADVACLDQEQADKGFHEISDRSSPALRQCGDPHSSLRRQQQPKTSLPLSLLLLLLAAYTDPRVATAAGAGAEAVDSSAGGGGGGGGNADVGCEPPRPLPEGVMVRWSCQNYSMMCIDQQQFISYDPAYNPRLSRKKLPAFSVKDVVYNWPNPWGNGDKFERGRDLHVAPVVLRVNTSEEASPDLRQPAFSRCTSPVVLWQRWMFNVGEVFETSYVRMWEEFHAGQVDPALSLVLATPHGLRLPKFARLFFEALYDKEVTSLAEFSARRHDMRQRSNATAEGWHVRCFERVTLCRLRNRKEDTLCAAGAHLLRHYGPRLPPVSDLFHPELDRETLKVVFAGRPNATGRALLNEGELLAACNALQPEELMREGGELGEELGGGRKRYRRVKCVSHVFGGNLLYDLALAASIDVLVATHGAAGYHSFYMSRGSSLIEILPYKFSHQWVNLYYAKMLQFEKKVFYWSIWIQDPLNSRPSAFEDADVFREAYAGRERHVSLPWPALRRHLANVLQVGGNALSYKSAYLSGRHSISDGLQPVENRLDLGKEGWEGYKGDKEETTD
ncbi:hypothetical protein Agub_g9337 [Astrephomene gubernaculifera]|uniref:Glycosyltransferase n=1 Tax=Astrephomene gubernaculifera TaxID=47775 RepID=A0AAD3HNV0_9CHLO|nr:hypothetical protein Agub_g9337 [Astrephomene gubernaculifera]